MIKKKSKIGNVPDNFNPLICWKDYLTPIHTQGFCGGCWSIASTDTLALRYNIQSKGHYNLHLSWPKLLVCTLGGGLRFQVISKNS